MLDMRPVRVRTARTFLDGFAAIRKGEAALDVPIFAAMSPTDQARCLPAAPEGLYTPEPEISTYVPSIAAS